MAPRSIWNGAVAFGLVQVPIKVYSATESKTVHFREVHLKDSSRIEHRWIFHDRERAVAVRTYEKGLALNTLRFAADLVDPADFELPRVSKKPSSREIEMASKLVEGLHVEFKPGDYEDQYRDAVLDVVK